MQQLKLIVEERKKQSVYYNVSVDITQKEDPFRNNKNKPHDAKNLKELSKVIAKTIKEFYKAKDIKRLPKLQKNDKVTEAI